jgi:plastocyanin
MRHLGPARSLIVAGLAAVLAMGLVGCGDDDDDSAAPAATTAAAGGAATTAGGAAATTSAGGAATTAAAGGGGAETTEVIKSLSFTTSEVKVAVGGSVVFDNQDNTAHTATADDGSFDTGQISAGSKKTVEFAKAGSVPFHCTIHPFMKATVVIA